MSKRQRKTKQARWIVALMMLVAAVLYFHISGNNITKRMPDSKDIPRYKLEKTGAGVTADFTTASRNIHSAVDSFIAGANLKVEDSKETNKEVPRHEIEGTIRWHNRQLLVISPLSNAEILKQRAAEKVASAGGDILEMQSDQYQGTEVLRLDIGIKDRLGSDVVTVITDRIYIRQPGVAAVPKKSTATGKGRMAIVIDDFGYSSEPINAFAAIDRPLTFAVLPYRPHSNEAAARGVSSGHQVILHLPLEPLSASSQSEQITIGSGMSDSEIRETAARAIRAVPGIIGVNNHQGSRATADSRVMQQVLSEIKAHNLFFLDSRTTGQSVVAATARQIGVNIATNELFIDNDNNVAAVKRQLRTARDIALRDGSVIVIGHARITTATAVREMIPEIEESGIRLVFVSEMVR